MADHFENIPHASIDLVRANSSANEAADCLLVAFWAETRSDEIDTFSRERAAKHVRRLAECLGYTLTPIAQTEAAE